MKNNYDSNQKETPISVKFSHITRGRIKQAAKLLGYSQNRVVSDTVEQTLCQIDLPDADTVPEILRRLRLLQNEKNKPAQVWARKQPQDRPQNPGE